MDSWPWDIELDIEATAAFDLGGKALHVERVNPTTLRYRVGTNDKQTRLVGVSETATKLRFVPTLGPIPLLIFPQVQLLCPAGSTVQCVLRLPLHVQVGVDDESGFRRIDEIVPASVSKALYGPVDSGVLCTSIHAPTAASIDEFEDRDQHSLPMLGRVSDDQSTSPQTHELVTHTRFRVRNETEEPLLVTKIMIPAGVMSLFQDAHRTHTNEVTMGLLSAQEAELEFLKCPIDDTTPLPDLGGQRADGAPTKPHFFAHAYRSKTGLDFGF
jgi:hypothetical protein